MHQDRYSAAHLSIIVPRIHHVQQFEDLCFISLKIVSVYETVL